MSCQKDAEIISPISQTADNPANTSVVRIQSVSDNYLANIQPVNSEAKFCINWKRVFKIVGKDFLGALKGAPIGLAAGTALPGVGNGVGLLIGAGVGAAGASLDAAGSTIHNPNGDGSGNPNAANINFEEYANSLSNEFDNIGLVHYQLCNGFIASIDDGQGIQEFYTYGLNEMVNIFDLPIDEAEAYTIDLYNTDIDFTQDNNVGISLTEKVNYLHTNEMISSAIHDIMVPYMNSFEESTDINDFVNYSLEVENIVAENNELNETDKKIILISMATARYGVQYWSDILE